MTSTPSRSLSALHLYVGGLSVVLVSILACTATMGDGFTSPVADWLVVTCLIAVSESVDLFFHHERGRQSLSVIEAVLYVMLLSFTPTEVVWGVTIAMIAVKAIQWREGGIRALFNIDQIGCSAAAAAWVYSVLASESQALTVRNSVVAAVAVLVYAALNHAFVAGAITLAEGARFTEIIRSVGPATVLNLAGNLVLGTLLAASYLGARWTLAIFPLPLLVLFLGYRAVLRQGGERDRVENLYLATRALASNLDLKRALKGFLDALSEIASTQEARVVLGTREELRWSGVRNGEAVADLDIVLGGPMQEVLQVVSKNRSPLIVAGDDAGQHAQLLEDLGVHSFLAVPLIDGDAVVGCLVVLDRLGADDFVESDARLLESLANELVVTLDSHRLFEVVVEERERFRRIFEGSQEGVCLLDEHARVLAWNPALERISGYGQDELLGRVWSDAVLIRGEREHRLEALELVRTPEEDELELVTRHGPTRWIAVLAGPVQAPGGAGWVVLVRDVTGEHQAEEAKSDFLSTISHELRTPLTTIKGSLMVLAREGTGPQLREQMVGVLQRGSDRLERLVMNLLTVSQLESSGGEIRVFNEEIELDLIVDGATKRVLVEHQSVDVVWNARDVIVRADRERLAQAIEHLLDNALKYGDPEGKITVTVSKANGWATVAVTDEGPGISAADQERIFDRFVRLGDVLTREKQGAGVGLYIARRSAEAMGGGIDVDSEPGHGATFTLRVPLARPEVVTSEAS